MEMHRSHFTDFDLCDILDESSSSISCFRLVAVCVDILRALLVFSQHGLWIGVDFGFKWNELEGLSFSEPQCPHLRSAEKRGQRCGPEA